MIGAWRYKSRVLTVSDAILSSMGPHASKMFFRTGFWGPGWKGVIKDGYRAGVGPTEIAVDLVTASIRNVVAKSLTPDQRAMTLHAIKTGNNADVSANHFVAILEGIRTVARPMIFKTAMYELIGALEGRQGEELDNYRSGRLLEDVLKEHEELRAQG